jgi:hypothetical protein
MLCLKKINNGAGMILKQNILIDLEWETNEVAEQPERWE